MEVSKNIRTIREHLGLTQQDLAIRLNTERSNYARLESRDMNLTIRQLEDISLALGVTIHDLLGSPKLDNKIPDQTDTIFQLESRIKNLEEILRSKKRDIKFYNQVLTWVKEKFYHEFTLAKTASTFTELPESSNAYTIEDYLEKFDLLSEQELKSVGDEMFEHPALYFLMNFLASSGFITEKWFIDAYKRKARKEKVKVSPSEALNYINSAFEFMNSED